MGKKYLFTSFEGIKIYEGDSWFYQTKKGEWKETKGPHNSSYETLRFKNKPLEPGDVIIFNNIGGNIRGGITYNKEYTIKSTELNVLDDFNAYTECGCYFRVASKGHSRYQSYYQLVEKQNKEPYYEIY